MGLSSGSKQLRAATAGTLTSQSTPLTGVLPCKKGETLLKVFLLRIDTDIALGGETVKAGTTSPGAPKPTANVTGLADFGVVQPDTYFFDVQLSGPSAEKYHPYVTTSSKVPKQVDFHATLRIVPIAKLLVVITDSDAGAVKGASWRITAPADALPLSGTTADNGLIDAVVPWDGDAAQVEITLPKGKRVAKPAVVGADATDPPPYPVTIRQDHWDPAPAKSLAKAADGPVFLLEATLVGLPDADDDAGTQARLANLGFPKGDATRIQRSVKAYQRLHEKKYAGSGLLADIQAHLVQLHDTL